MELGQYVTITHEDVNPRYAGLVWKIEWLRKLKDGTPVAHLVSLDDAREGKLHMRRLDSVPVSVLTVVEA